MGQVASSKALPIATASLMLVAAASALFPDFVFAPPPIPFAPHREQALVGCFLLVQAVLLSPARRRAVYAIATLGALAAFVACLFRHADLSPF